MTQGLAVAGGWAILLALLCLLGVLLARPPR